MWNDVKCGSVVERAGRGGHADPRSRKLPRIHRVVYTSEPDLIQKPAPEAESDPLSSRRTENAKPRKKRKGNGREIEKG